MLTHTTPIRQTIPLYSNHVKNTSRGRSYRWWIRWDRWNTPTGIIHNIYLSIQQQLSHRRYHWWCCCEGQDTYLDPFVDLLIITYKKVTARKLMRRIQHDCPLIPQGRIRHPFGDTLEILYRMNRMQYNTNTNTHSQGYARFLL